MRKSAAEIAEEYGLPEDSYEMRPIAFVMYGLYEPMGVRWEITRIGCPDDFF